MFNLIVPKSFYSPKVGESLDRQNFITILDTLPLTDTKTLILFSRVNSKYNFFSVDVPHYLLVTYYGKIWDTSLPLSNVEEDSFFIDNSVIYSYYDFQINYYGDGHLTSGIKAQITPDGKILITWLKAEIDYGYLGGSPPPLIG